MEQKSFCSEKHHRDQKVKLHTALLSELHTCPTEAIVHTLLNAFFDGEFVLSACDGYFRSKSPRVNIIAILNNTRSVTTPTFVKVACLPQAIAALPMLSQGNIYNEGRLRSWRRAIPIQTKKVVPATDLIGIPDARQSTVRG